MRYFKTHPIKISQNCIKQLFYNDFQADSTSSASCLEHKLVWKSIQHIDYTRWHTSINFDQFWFTTKNYILRKREMLSRDKKNFHPKSCNRCYRDKSVLFQILKNDMLIIFTCMFKRCTFHLLSKSKWSWLENPSENVV